MSTNRRILVPTDGSERAEEAADYAIGLAAEHGAAMLFLSVVDEIYPAYAFETEAISPTIPEIEDQIRKAATGYVEKLEKKASDAGLRAESKVVDGHPWEQILKEADSWNANHIIMGSHGRRALAAAVLGSVTINVLHGAKVPVTVVPWRPEEEQ